MCNHNLLHEINIKLPLDQALVLGWYHVMISFAQFNQWNNGFSTLEFIDWASEKKVEVVRVPSVHSSLHKLHNCEEVTASISAIDEQS